MIKLPHRIQPVYVLVDIFLISVAFFTPYVFKYNDIGNVFININLPNATEYCFVFVLEVIFITRSFKHKRLYGTDREITIPKELVRVITCIFYSGIMVGSVIFFAHYLFFSRFIFIVNFALLIPFLGGFRIIKRLILRNLIREGFRNVNILIVGTGRISEMVVKEIQHRRYLGFNIVGFLDDSKEGFVENIPILGGLSAFDVVAKRFFIDEVIITLLPEKKAVT
jgi:FlaA1/EpsC-like NDP-sugar epimerase